MANQTTTEYKEKIEELINGHYEHISFKNKSYLGEKMYLLRNGNVFHIDIISNGRFCVEYADSISDAENLTLEDGDSFYMEDYPNAGAMVIDILAEIAQREQ